MDVLNVTALAHDELSQLNPEQYEIHLKDRRETIYFLQNLKSHKSQFLELTVRVIDEGRLGSSTISLDNLDQIPACVRAAYQQTRSPLTQKNPGGFFKFGSTLYQEVDGFDARGVAVSEASKFELLKAATADMSVDDCILNEVQTRIDMLDSNGERITQTLTHYKVEITHQNTKAIGHSRYLDSLKIDVVAKNAFLKSQEMQAATPGKNIKGPTIIRNEALASALEFFSTEFAADRISKGDSILTGMEGKRIASENISIIHDGLLPGGNGTLSFDDEGYPTQRTDLVESGVMIDSLYDSFTAFGKQRLSNGCATRDQTGALKVGIQNIYICHGKKSFQDLVNSMPQGFLITRLWDFKWDPPLDPLKRGGFGAKAEGIVIENGKPTRPVRQLLLRSSFMDFFSQVNEVAHDLVFSGQDGKYGAPSAHFIELSLSGA